MQTWCPYYSGELTVPHWSVVSLYCFDAGTSLPSFHQSRAQLLITKCCGGNGGIVPKTRPVFWVSRIHEDKLFLHLFFTEATAKKYIFLFLIYIEPCSKWRGCFLTKGCYTFFLNYYYYFYHSTVRKRGNLASNLSFITFHSQIQICLNNYQLYNVFRTESFSIYDPATVWKTKLVRSLPVNWLGVGRYTIAILESLCYKDIYVKS